MTSASALAGVEPRAKQEYSRDFNVGFAQAARNLEIQDQGSESGLVEGLEGRLGGKYAGVWFDNDVGEFVVPLLPAASGKAVEAELASIYLDSDFRIVPAEFSWEALEAAHERVDEALLSLIARGLIQTSIDPRANAVVISEANDIDPTARMQIEKVSHQQGVDVEVREKDVERFSVSLQACKTTTPRACGRPLRGGVSLTPTCQNCVYATGECTAGFKATGKLFGNRYVLTAGHCAQKFSHWGSEDAGGTWHDIGLVEEYSYPTHDWAKIKANGSEYWDWNPWPTQVAHFWEDQERAITAESGSYIGQYVCHSGNKTGTSCGNVSAVDVTMDMGVGLVYHATEFGKVCSIGGDSGGPVFAGNTALGIFSAVDETSAPPACQSTGYYTEITEATDALGVTVAPREGAQPSAETNPGVSAFPYKGATVTGKADPNGLATDYYFQYGKSGAGFTHSTPVKSAGSSWQPVAVEATLPNLKSQTGYHFRLVATNSKGTSYGYDHVFSTPQWNENANLAFVRLNHILGAVEVATYGDASPYASQSAYSIGGYPSITDPQNVASVAIDIDGSGTDELGFVRLNHSSGNAELALYDNAPFYNILAKYTLTGYPAISDPQNVQVVAIDTDGDGVDELGFVRLNHSSGNAELSLYDGPNYTTLSGYYLTGYPKVTDPQNIRVVALDIDASGTDELGFVRTNHSSGSTELVTYAPPTYKNQASYSLTGYPKISDPQNVQVLSMDIDGSGNDELGFARTNHSSGKVELVTYAPPTYKNQASYSLTGYPTMSDPQNVRAIASVSARPYPPAPKTWHGYGGLGGVNTSDPDPTSMQSGHLDVFARGNDAALWHRSHSGGSWSGWSSLGGSLPSGAGPGAVSWANGRMDVVARTSTGNITHWWYDGSWHSNDNLGGNFTNDPDVASMANGHLAVFARGTDGALWIKTYNNGWSGWSSLGGSIASDSGVGAVSWDNGRMDVVARAPGNNITHWWYDGSWHSGDNLGGSFTGTPDISSRKPGVLDIFVRGTDGTLRHQWYDQGWGTWENLGGQMASGSGPGAVSWADGRIDVFGRATDNTLFQWWWQ